MDFWKSLLSTMKPFRLGFSFLSCSSSAPPKASIKIKPQQKLQLSAIVDKGSYHEIMCWERNNTF